MFRFYIALWISKIVMFIFKLKGSERNDWPGLLAYKLCPQFLKYINKPPLVIAITGTNGKTTTSALINNKLVADGYRVSFNDWGANLQAGFGLNLMRCVNFLNKPTKMDVAVLEADEKTLDDTMTLIEPDYILVTNICKDSLRRNGHPEFIFDHVERTFNVLGNKTVAILNANDPISSQLAADSGARRVFYGMADIGADPFENTVKDISVCPVCGDDIQYNYRLYRHIGDFYCNSCDFAAPHAKYFAEAIDHERKELIVKEDGERSAYSLISDTVFNAFNVLSYIALMRELGTDKQELADFLRTQRVTKIRETSVEFNGIEYLTYAAKSQNVSAASTVFEYMAKEPSVKELVLLLDEMQDRNHPSETITWLYETDYEFLNSPNIKKIIVGGHMYLNHRLRLLLAGIDESKIVCVEDESEIVDHVDRSGIEKVYVLFEIDYVTKARKMRDMIVERAKEEAAK